MTQAAEPASLHYHELLEVVRLRRSVRKFEKGRAVGRGSYPFDVDDYAAYFQRFIASNDHVIGT
jgi:hypothetical protein